MAVANSTSSELESTLRELQQLVDGFVSGRRDLRVLEAGCGSASHVSFGPARMVGIDISAKQLERNDRLDEKIVGDLQEHDLGCDQYDVIVCWDVLEHLRRPDLVLSNFGRAVKPDGLIILAMPNPHSGEGTLTKLTPHCFHVWVHRRIFGNPLAGTDDRPPFPTYMRLIIGERGIRRFAHRAGLVCAYARLYDRGRVAALRKKHPLLFAAARMFASALQIITIGRFGDTRSSSIFVLQKTS